MNKKSLFLPIFIIISLFIWLICPWNNSSLASESFYSVHTAHGHTSGHEEESHHASKGDHGCITPISFSKEDTSSKIPPIHLEHLKTDVFNYQVRSASFQLAGTQLPERFIHLYQLYSVYLL